MDPIGLISTGGSVVQSLSLTSAVDFYVGAAQNYTMTSGTAVNATGNVVIDVDGNVNLRQLAANHVAINAGGNILDADVDENVNILAATAILNAVGSIGANNALVGASSFKRECIRHSSGDVKYSKRCCRNLHPRNRCWW